MFACLYFSVRFVNRPSVGPSSSCRFLLCHELKPPTPINHPQAIKDAGVQEGWVNVVSRHTTTAVTLNECESRLMDDVRQFLLKLAPPSYPYLHNDIHLRPATEDVRACFCGRCIDFLFFLGRDRIGS